MHPIHKIGVTTDDKLRTPDYRQSYIKVKLQPLFSLDYLKS